MEVEGQGRGNKIKANKYKKIKKNKTFFKINLVLVYPSLNVFRQPKRGSA